MQSKPQSADTLRAQPYGRRHHEIGAVRFEQIGRANIRLKTLGYESHHVHEGFSGLASLIRKMADFFQREDMIRVGCVCGWPQVSFPFTLGIKSSEAQDFRQPH
jgi:hypothetical protein